eukprot:5001499-Prymnesium_polylepis.1
MAPPCGLAVRSPGRRQGAVPTWRRRAALRRFDSPDGARPHPHRTQTWRRPAGSGRPAAAPDTAVQGRCKGEGGQLVCVQSMAALGDEPMCVQSMAAVGDEP